MAVIGVGLFGAAVIDAGARPSSEAAADTAAAEARTRAIERTIVQTKGLDELAADGVVDDARAAAMEETIQALLEEEAAMSEREPVESAPWWRKPVVLAGGASTKFSVREGAKPVWSETISPHLISTIGERALFESHVDLRVHDDGETDAELEFAHLSYVVNDALTVGSGIFLVPFGFYNERIHAGWINKLPDTPLSVGDDSLTPTSGLGVQLRGGLPLGSTARANYAVYVANGPQVNQGTHSAHDAGKLEFTHYSGQNFGKAVGFRAGWLPIPEVEMGYSLMRAGVESTNPAHEDLRAWLQGVDLNYKQMVRPLKGTMEARAEWIWSDVDRADFGGGAFDNERSGGYVQLAYRPSMAAQKLVKRFEVALRYDMLNLPSGAPAFDRQRWTAGLDYWLAPHSALKVAYQFSQEDRATPGQDESHGVLTELYLGF